jgi:hypothetical protein
MGETPSREFIAMFIPAEATNIPLRKKRILQNNMLLVPVEAFKDM